MCDHGEDKEFTYLPILSDGRHEIYQCECGALIDMRAPENDRPPYHAITPQRLTDLIWLLEDRLITEARDATVAALREVAQKHLVEVLPPASAAE